MSLPSFHALRTVPRIRPREDCYTLKELGEFARKAREKMRDTQEEAAARLGVEQSMVSAAESGESRQKKTLFRLIEDYTSFKVDRDEHYRLIQAGESQ